MCTFFFLSFSFPESQSLSKSRTKKTKIKRSKPSISLSTIHAFRRHIHTYKFDDVLSDRSICEKIHLARWDRTRTNSEYVSETTIPDEHVFPAHNIAVYFTATAIHRTFFPQDDRTICCYWKKDAAISTFLFSYFFLSLLSILFSALELPLACVSCFLCVDLLGHMYECIFRRLLLLLSTKTKENFFKLDFFFCVALMPSLWNSLPDKIVHNQTA